MPSVAFVTLTNDGYIDYTLNCLKSLEKCGFTGNLISYCIGMSCYERLKSSGYEARLLEGNNNTEFEVYKKKKWSLIMHAKFDIITDCLKTHDYVCFTDGDIVFHNPKFLDNLLLLAQNYELLIQNDAGPGCQRAACAGFMFLKSNEKIKYLFDPERTRAQCYEDSLYEDQTYINSILKQIKFKLLSQEDYPNGAYFYSQVPKNPSLVHFNWIVGNEKKDKMKEAGMWYISN